MDKNSFEMYEYLTVPANDSTADNDQFFVVHEDETFFINKQSSVQYVTQVPDQDESLANVQQCTVYDVSSQQIYVDIDNTAELISVPGNLMLPDGTNNLYANSYLLESLPSTSSNQLEEDIISDQFKDGEVQEVAKPIGENKQIENYTEITLNDEQYNMLQEKGWVLLETNDKVYILDTLGLHDITTNEELIQQLKMEKQIKTNLQPDLRTEDVQVDDCVPQNIKTENKNGIVESVNELHNAAEVAVEEDAQEKDTSEAKLIKLDESSLDDEISENSLLIKDAVKKSNFNGSVMKLETKFSFKDIPDRVVLGRTPSGKRLVAKVKYNGSTPRLTSSVKDNKLIDRATQIIADHSKLNERQWESLIQKALSSNLKTESRELDTIIELMKQLLLLADFQTAAKETDGKVFITKALKNNDKSCQSETLLPSLVTGRVINVDKSQQFIHIPDFLKNIAEHNKTPATQNLLDSSRADSVLHVHITETRKFGNLEGISITYNKRKLSKLCTTLPVINNSYPNKQHKRKVYACSACATTFALEEDLIHHQDNGCLDTDDTLTIDDTDIDAKENDQESKPTYYLVQTKSGKMYCCIQCNTKFTKLCNCQRHFKTHFVPQVTKEKSEKSSTPSYKCKMCPSSFIHPSTLSKHIVKSHVKINNI